ncbi:MAG: dTDP-glucose 4,6-dehydratase [Hyphomicrobiaceae bacterium]|nr:dTDP-glucose 4,6-dehydratase [Hyphomicrobiaceae bacterium]
MRILVTGGAGFVGSALCRHLVGEKGISVLNVDKLAYATKPSSLEPIANNPNYRFLKADICERAVMDQALFQFSPNAIIHLAARNNLNRSLGGVDTFINANIVGTYTVLEAARGYWSGLGGAAKDAFRFLQASTDEVYGSLGWDGLFTEQTAYEPSTPYAASKAASDHLVMAWHRTYGFPALISNCCNNYGPYQFPAEPLPSMILNAVDGRPLTIHGDGSYARDWLHVDDHARALLTILEKGQVGERYNVGGRNEHTDLDLAIRICEILNIRYPDKPSHGLLITSVEDPPGKDQRRGIDATKLEHELQWRAQESFESGLEATIDWYLANRDWWEPLRRNARDGRQISPKHDEASSKTSRFEAPCSMDAS